MANATLPAKSDSTLFRVVIRAKLSKKNDDAETIRARVQSIFDIYCKSSSNKFSGAFVNWVDAPVAAGAIEANEIVAYLLDSATASLIKQKIPGIQIDPTSTGQTYTGGAKNLTEIYLKHAYHDEPEFIANTIIHELMHNKLNQGDEMHELDPMRLDDLGFAQERMPRSKKLMPSSADKNAMGPAMGKNVAQFLGI